MPAVIGTVDMCADVGRCDALASSDKMLMDVCVLAAVEPCRMSSFVMLSAVSAAHSLHMASSCGRAPRRLGCSGRSDGSTALLNPLQCLPKPCCMGQSCPFAHETCSRHCLIVESRYLSICASSIFTHKLLASRLHLFITLVYRLLFDIAM